MDTRIQQIIDTHNSVFDLFPIKILGGVLVGLFSFFFDQVHIIALASLFMLSFFDMISAIVAVRKTPGETVRSQMIGKTGIKLGMYCLAISAGHLTESTLAAVPDFLMVIDETFIGVFAVTELLSICENLSKTGYTVPTKLIDTLSNYKKKL